VVVADRTLARRGRRPRRSRLGRAGHRRPRVAGYNNQAFWAIYEVDLVAFIGMSYGGAVVSAILRITKATWRAALTRIAEATALVTLPIGMLFIVPHLGSPWRVWELVWPPYWNLSSPILWDFFAVSTYLLVTTVFFYLALIPDLAIARGWLGPERTGLRARACRSLYQALGGRWDGSARQRRLLHGAIGLVAIMIIPMAVSVHSVLSFAFASSSRAGYLETILPVYFVVAALYSGIALVVLAAAACRRLFNLEALIHPRHFVRLGFIMVAFGAVYLYLTFTEYLIDGYSGTTDNAAWVRQVLVGRYWIPFWFYFVAAGLVPLVIMALPRLRTPKGVIVASGLVVFAMWVKRLVIVVAPSHRAARALTSCRWWRARGELGHLPLHLGADLDHCRSDSGNPAGAPRAVSLRADPADRRDGGAGRARRACRDHCATGPP